MERYFHPSRVSLNMEMYRVLFTRLERYRGKIIDGWVRRLLSQTDSPYAKQSEEGLRVTVAQAYEGFHQVLVGVGWDYLDSFISLIAKRRLSEGFKLSDVQKAFMVYLEVVTPYLTKEAKAGELDDAIVAVGRCISQTVGKFSDFFQELHDECMRQNTVALAHQAASLAHDIRNPLTAIKMNVQMLAAELKGDATHHRLLDISLKEVESIQRSVEEMMDLARPFRLNRENVPLQPFIHGCIDALRARMVHQGVTISTRLNPKLEQLYMDPHRMEQTLVNLLFNALEAVPAGGRIFVSSGIVKLQGRRWATISIADNGPGIPEELLPYFFDDKRNRRIGLGLDNVRRIVQAHGGAVEVGNRHPHGLKISFRLPLEA